MMKTIVAIFTIYELSSCNRLLLQTPVIGAPPAVPVVIPAIPVPAVPAFIPPIAVEPPVIGAPVVIPPPQPIPFPMPPVGPTVPVSPPINPPVAPWTIPGGTAPIAPGRKLECKITPPAAGSCSGTIQTATNPDLNWELMCSGTGSCYGSTVNIDFSPTAMVMEELKKMSFTAPYAGAGAVININNPTGRQIRIAEVICDKQYSCQGTTFYLGSDAFIEQGDFFCNAPGSCDNCWVKENAMDVGLPCTAYVEQI